MMFRSQILQFTEFNKILNLAFTGAKRKVLDRYKIKIKIKNEK